MKSGATSGSVASDQQETYVRTRDGPFFGGMRRGEAAITNKGSAFDFQGKSVRKNVYRSASDIGDRASRNINITDVTYSPKNTFADIVLEPIGRTSSGRWSKTSSPLRVIQSDLDEPSRASSPEANEESSTLSGLTRPAIHGSYNLSKRQTDISNVPLPLSAALFYCGPSPQVEVVQSCESIQKLNMYLKAKRDDVNAGIPGRFLHAVIGPDVADVGSVASIVMYAFYLDMTLKSRQFCTVPVINMKRADVESHADLQWLLASCCVDTSSLIFIDEIDLSYYDLFGSLKLVLLNCDNIPSEQEALREAIIEVFHCTKSDTSYSWVDSITVREDASCCTVVAEYFSKNSPEILAGQGFSRLLLAGILLDTENLSSSQCTAKDKYMATLLLNGAGRFGCNGLYQILKYKSYGSSDLKVEEILRKEFKKWSGLDRPNIGMSSIGVSVSQLLSHDSTSIQEIINFQKLEKLGILMVVSGYYDYEKNFKREILMSAESAELMKNLLLFLDSNAAQLPLKLVHQSGLEDKMRVFEIDKVTSRKTIEGLLVEFISVSNSS